MTNVEIGKRINELNRIRPVDTAVLNQMETFFATLTANEKLYAASYGSSMASVEMRARFKRLQLISAC
jgi:hypothetical protein